MPLSTAAKAALCVCPPAAMVGTVATVPAAKRAVHHLTAPRHAPRHAPSKSVAAANAAPTAAADHREGCDPAAAGGVAAAPLVTYAAPIPEEPGGAGGTATSRTAGTASGDPGGGGGAIAVIGATAPAPIGGIGIGPISTPGGSVTAVPEPASWAMLIAGAGAMGATLRRRRRVAVRSGGAVTGSALWGTTGAIEAGDAAATVVAKSTLASVAGKAMLCACPAAVVVGSVVAVPPVRHAVHTATAPSATSYHVPVVTPCSQPMPVTISAGDVRGFPETVTTVAART